jgi:hypothetical protein
MITASVSKRRAYLVIGGVGCFLAVGYIALSLQLPVGSLNSPGAAVFPLMVGGMFVLGSLSVLWEGLRMAPSDTAELPAGEDVWRLVALAASIVAYVVLIPWLGQFIASTLFCIVLMKVLMPSLSPLGVVVRSLILMAPIHYLFVEVMRVPMPRGVLFPF